MAVAGEIYAGIGCASHKECPTVEKLAIFYAADAVRFGSCRSFNCFAGNITRPESVASFPEAVFWSPARALELPVTKETAQIQTSLFKRGLGVSFFGTMTFYTLVVPFFSPPGDKSCIISACLDPVFSAL